MERVHCDLSTFSDKYVSVIIDEYSRKASIKILKFKNETVDHIKNWININENKLNLKVKEFHSDGGGEYTAAELQTFLKQKGIQTTITCKGTPQHNGIAERYNRTLFNTARCLLQHAKLGMEFAEYAIKTAAHLLQFRQSVTDKTKTAYELFYGVQPSIKHLRVFGCNAFVYTNDNSKLEPRAMTGIFIGYSELHINGYEILLNETGKVVTSRNVEFDESKFTFGARLHQSRMHELLQPNHIPASLNPNISIPISNYNDNSVNLDNYYQCLQSNDSIVFDQNESNANESTNDSNQSNYGTEIIDHEPSQARSRPQRTKRQPQRYGYINMNDVYDEDRISMNMNIIESINQDPLSVEEALNSNRAKVWKIAMDKKIKQLNDNRTWTLCELPKNRKAIGNKWVFKTKLNSDGTIEREKARLCAQGFSQVPYVDFVETFAPVMMYKSLRILLAISTIKSYEIKHLDVQTAFLNATLKEEVYMKQPIDYELKSKDGKDLVCKLNKSIYGLKQASNEWNREVSITIESSGFTRCKSDTCVYWKPVSNGNIIILAIFVDDIIVIHSREDNDEWNKLKQNFEQKYKVKDNTNSNFLLGTKIERGNKSMRITQELQIAKTLKQFDMENCKAKGTSSETLRLTQSDCPST